MAQGESVQRQCVGPQSIHQLSESFEETQRKHCKMGGSSCHIAISSPQQEKSARFGSDDKNHLEVIAEASLKLDNDTVLAMPCVLGTPSSGSPQACDTLIESRDQARTNTRSNASHLDHISGEIHVGFFRYGLVHKPMPTPVTLKNARSQSCKKSVKSLLARDGKKVKPKAAAVQ